VTSLNTLVAGFATVTSISDIDLLSQSKAKQSKPLTQIIWLQYIKPEMLAAVKERILITETQMTGLSKFHYATQLDLL